MIRRVIIAFAAHRVAIAFAVGRLTTGAGGGGGNGGVKWEFMTALVARDGSSASSEFDSPKWSTSLSAVSSSVLFIKDKH